MHCVRSVFIWQPLYSGQISWGTSKAILKIWRIFKCLCTFLQTYLLHNDWNWLVHIHNAWYWNFSPQRWERSHSFLLFCSFFPLNMLLWAVPQMNLLPTPYLKWRWVSCFHLCFNFNINFNCLVRFRNKNHCVRVRITSCLAQNTCFGCHKHDSRCPEVSIKIYCE